MRAFLLSGSGVRHIRAWGPPGLEAGLPAILMGASRSRHQRQTGKSCHTAEHGQQVRAAVLTHLHSLTISRAPLPGGDVRNQGFVA